MRRLRHLAALRRSFLIARRMSPAAVRIAFAIVGLGAPAAGRAQAARAASETAACIASVPDRALRDATLTVGFDRELTAPEVAPIARRVVALVSAEMRGLLGGSPFDPEPAVAGALSWRSIPGVHARLAWVDGALSWQVRGEQWGAPPPSDSLGLQLLAQALDGVKDSLRALPAPSVGDAASALFDLELGWRAGHVVAIRDGGERAALPSMTPVAYLRAPTVESARVVSLRPPSYPEEARSSGFGGTLDAYFVIDERGRADERTLFILGRQLTVQSSQLWREPSTRNPDGTVRLASAEGAQRHFVEAVRSSIRNGRFRPARMDQCAVRQLVKQPMIFRLMSGL